DGFSSASGAVRSAAGFPVFRLVMPLVPKVEKGGQPVGSTEHDVAPIAAVRASARHEHFAAEAADAIPAATRFHCNGDFVDKHRIHLIDEPTPMSPKRGQQPWRDRFRPWQYPHPCRRLRGDSGERKTRWLRGRGHGVDADLLSRASAFEFDDSRHAGEESMVFAKADIETGEELGSALAHDDGARLHGFTAVRFHAEVLWIAVPPVSR